MNLSALTGKTTKGLNLSSLTGREEFERGLKLRRIRQEAEAAQKKAEFLGSPFGLAIGTIKGILGATKEIATEVGQSMMRNIASVIDSEALKPVTKPITTKLEKLGEEAPFFKFFSRELSSRLYGDLSSQEVTELTGETRAEQIAPIGERTLKAEARLKEKAKEYKELSKIEGLNTRERIVTETLGEILDKGAGPLAFAMITGYTALDLTSFGGSQKNALKAIKTTTKAGDAVKLLKSMGVADDLVRTFADEVVKVKTQKQAKGLFDSIVKLQTTTKGIEVGKNLPAVIRGETFVLGPSETTQPTMKELRKTLKTTIKATKSERKAAKIAEEKAIKLTVKNQKIREEAIENVNTLRGNTDNIIEKLKKKHLSDEDISNIVLEDGTKLVDTVKVKRNPDKSLATVIIKSQINDVAKNYTDVIPKGWEKVGSIKSAKETTIRLAKGIELPQIWFDRKGLSGMYDDVIEAGRAAEYQKTIYINRFKEAGLFKEGIFTKEGGWITPARFTLSKKEAENVAKYYLKRQNRYPFSLPELGAREKKFIEIFDGIIKETEPRFFDVAKKMGKEPSKVKGYAPIMTAEDIKLIDQGGAMDWLFRKHPSFFSLKERVKQRVPVNMYELDYRKVASRWLAGITDFLNYGETTQNLKYFIESDQFKKLVKKEDYEIISNWLKNITTPNLPTSAPGKSANALSRVLRKGIAMGVLGLNYASVLKQALTQIPIMIIEKARPKLKSQYAKAFGINVAELPSITKRSGDIAITDLQGKVGRAFTGPLTRFDRKNAQVALNALLDKEWNKFLKEGVEITPEIQKLIEKRAQDTIDMWFGGFFKGQRPEVFRNELGNTILMFLYPLTSQLNGFYKHILKAKGISKVGAGASVLAAATTIAYAERVIENLSFNWSDKLEMTKDVTQSLAGNIPIVSQIAYSITTEQPFSPSPIISSVNNVIKDINKGIDDGKWEEAIFSIAAMAGFPRQIERVKQGIEIINEGGIRDKEGKMLAPVKETDEIMRSILRGKYGSLAAKDWIRNIGEKVEDRRWFIPQVEFLQNGDYKRKAELYRQFTATEQAELRSYLSEAQQKKLDKALEGDINNIFEKPTETKKKSLEEIFK